MKHPATVLLALLFLGSIPLHGEARPNIVILYADDMGVADVSYGNPEAKIQTPNLDKLASEGMTFTDGHSSSGICTPSRFALLTIEPITALKESQYAHEKSFKSHSHNINHRWSSVNSIPS